MSTYSPPARGHAVIALLRKADRFLILQRGPEAPPSGYWAPLSGRIEPGESQEDALVREVREEIGLQVEPIAKVYECDTDDGRYRLYWWTTTVPDDELTLDAGEVSAARWVTLEEYLKLEPIFEGDLHFFTRVYPTLPPD